MFSLPLESEFQVVRLKLHLQQHPEIAVDFAVQQYKAFLALSIEYNRLKAELKSLTASKEQFANN